MGSDDEAPDAVPIPEDAAEEADQPKMIPVTLITGFLGAGKTTLVRHILTEKHGYKVAVILNEIGEGVEGSYFEAPDGTKAQLDEWVQLSNGCMCCSVKSEFVQAIEALIAKKGAGKSSFDYIVVETTGLANPGPVAAALWTDEDLQAAVQLDSIITVVDALNINRELHGVQPDAGAVNEAQQQIAYADLILLNKMDLVEEEAVVRAEADIRAINSSVHIYRTSSCALDLGLILNRSGYRRNADISLDPIAEDDGEEDEPRRGRQTSGTGTLEHSKSSRHRARSMSLDSNHHHKEGLGSASSSGAAPHDGRVQSVTLRLAEPLVLEKVKSFVDKLLWDRQTHPEDIYRVKGVLNIQGSSKRHVLQAVYELYDINPTQDWPAGKDKQSIVVIIGRNLNKAILDQWFADCKA